jgi:hypothetical protein
MTGRGWRQDSASGFIRYADDVIDDVRQGGVAPEFADITPGFGTHHPQDVKRLGNLSDPSPIRDADPEDRANLSVQDMNISDQEIKLSIQEGRRPRMGY